MAAGARRRPRSVEAGAIGRPCAGNDRSKHPHRGAILEPDLSVIAGRQRVARGIDGIEQRLLLVEISAVHALAERYHPTRRTTTAANAKLHDHNLLRSRG